jgi:CO/xanthine dehydrogenase Mo-binding subunit
VPTFNHPTTPMEPLLAIDMVRMIGEPIALVVASDEQSALAIVAAVKIEYDVQKPVFDPREALKVDAFRLHPGGNLYEYGEIKKLSPFDNKQPTDIQVELDYSLAT